MIKDRKFTKASTNWISLRDHELTRQILDSLKHDIRLSSLDLSVHVIGGVAHVRGNANSMDERQLIREFLRRQKGLSAVWDLIQVTNERLSVIDIGCGGKKQVPEAVGVDKYESAGADVVTDLEKRLPFEDKSADHIFAVHVLEHIEGLVGLMNELHRVMRSTGVLHILTPHWQNVSAVADPTHIRFFDSQTFKYFCEPNPGIKLWKPLIVTSTKDTVFADLMPINNNLINDNSDIARWFY